MEREKREGEEVKWWENLEAGQGVTEVKGSSAFMLN